MFVVIYIKMKRKGGHFEYEIQKTRKRFYFTALEDDKENIYRLILFLGHFGTNLVFLNLPIL